MNRLLALALAATCFAVPLKVMADQDNPECLGTECGKPKEEGGTAGAPCTCVVDQPCECHGVVGSVWVAYTDDGKTLAHGDDADGDGKADPVDNCAFVANRDQTDSDGDGVGDACDDCRKVANRTQADVDGDGAGDACDPDADGDGVMNDVDNCPGVANKDQVNTRRAHALANDPCPGAGDACCADADADGVPNAADNCPLVPNAGQSTEGIEPYLCSHDSDVDGVPDTLDDCIDVANPDQADTDKDGKGDACDSDLDGDGLFNHADDCPSAANPAQEDADRDGLGDACDAVYCYVTDPNAKDACLDPKAPFSVSAGASLVSPAGLTIRLPLFANRNASAMKYQWTVSRRPAGSEARISTPVGTVATSSDWLYQYPAEVPAFTPDVPGEYELQLKATLEAPDRLYPDQVTSVSSMRIVANQAGEGMGCSAAGGAPASFASLAVALMLLALKRRG